MRIFSLAVAAALALPVLSQMVSIVAPAPGETLTPGSDIIVELDSAVSEFLYMAIRAITPGLSERVDELPARQCGNRNRTRS